MQDRESRVDLAISTDVSIACGGLLRDFLKENNLKNLFDPTQRKEKDAVGEQDRLDYDTDSSVWRAGLLKMAQKAVESVKPGRLDFG